MVAFVVAFLMVVNTSLTAYASGPDELSKKSDDYSMDYNYEGNTLYNSDVITASMYSVENGNDDMIKPNSISIAALSAAIMAILAEHGASFQAGVIIGQFCKNNGINYWVGRVLCLPLPLCLYRLIEPQLCWAMIKAIRAIRKKI